MLILKKQRHWSMEKDYNLTNPSYIPINKARDITVIINMEII